MGRLVLATLESAGIPCTSVTFDRTHNRQEAGFSDRSAAVDADINVVCVNADQFPEFARSMGPEFFRNRYTIGYWAWETSQFPADFGEAFDYVDEVWGLSSFTANAIAERSPVPVRAAPLPVATKEPILPSTRFPPDRIVFLFSFDFLSVMGRKNPEGLITAFARAFEPDEGPLLVIKTINGHLRPEGVRALELAVGARDDIMLMDGYLSESERDALLARADAYVSLHRAEGFGLTIAEAMERGIPTISTGYSGNLDFAVPHDPLMVPFELTKVGPGYEPYAASAEWAEPDLNVAASLMRSIVERPAEARRLGEAAQTYVRTHHSIAARAPLFASLIDEARIRAGSGSKVSDSIDRLLTKPFHQRAEQWIKEQLRPLVHRMRARS